MTERIPPCSRCGFNIETAEIVWSSQHMLEVQGSKPLRGDDPFGRRVSVGLPYWVCGECHAPFEQVLRIVKEPPRGV
jgi:hypothetical protein